jgi:hypothetical protein
MKRSRLTVLAVASLLALAACGSSSPTGTGGSGGAGGSGAGGSGGSGGCEFDCGYDKTCEEAVQEGAPLFPTPAFEDLLACACDMDCMAPCGANLCDGLAADATCEGCMSAGACAGDYQSCLDEVI